MRWSERRRENEILIDFELLQVDYSALTLTIPKITSKLLVFNEFLMIKFNEVFFVDNCEWKLLKITIFWFLNFKNEVEICNVC